MDNRLLSKAGESLTCVKCDFVAPDAIALRSHVSYRHLDECIARGECAYCDFAFYDETVDPMQIRGMIWEHLIIIHKENLWMRATVPLHLRCATCGVCFYSDAELQEHVAVDHNNRGMCVEQSANQMEEPIASTSLSTKLATNMIAKSSNPDTALGQESYAQQEPTSFEYSDSDDYEPEEEYEDDEDLFEDLEKCRKNRRKQILKASRKKDANRGNKQLKSRGNKRVESKTTKYQKNVREKMERDKKSEQNDNSLELATPSQQSVGENLNQDFNFWARRNKFYFDGSVFNCMLCTVVSTTVIGIDKHLRKVHKKASVFNGVKCPVCLDYRYTGKNSNQHYIKRMVQFHFWKSHLTRCVRSIQESNTESQNSGDRETINTWTTLNHFSISKGFFECKKCCHKSRTLLQIANHLQSKHDSSMILAANKCPICDGYKYRGKYPLTSRRARQLLSNHLYVAHLKPLLLSSTASLNTEFVELGAVQIPTTDSPEIYDYSPFGIDSNLVKLNDWAKKKGFYYNGRLFVCSSCNHGSTSAIDIDCHLRKVHKKPTFFTGASCPICSEYEYKGKKKSPYLLLKYVNSHIREYHLKTSLKNMDTYISDVDDEISTPTKSTTSRVRSRNKCAQKSILKRNLQQKFSSNLQTTSYDNTIFCSSKVFRKISNFKHYSKSERLYKCKFCTYRGRSLLCVKHHMKRLHLHVCCYCKRMFRRKPLLLEHMTTQHAKDMKTCTFCHKKFFTSRRLELHHKIQHITRLQDTTQVEESTYVKARVNMVQEKVLTMKTLSRFNLTFLSVLRGEEKPNFRSHHLFQLYCRSLFDGGQCQKCGVEIPKHEIINHYLESHNPQGFGEHELFVASLRSNYRCDICGLDKVSQTHINYHRFVMRFLSLRWNFRHVSAIIPKFAKDCFYLSPELWTIFMKTTLFFKNLIEKQVYLCLWIPFEASSMEQVLKGFASYESQSQTISIPYAIINSLHIQRHATFSAGFVNSDAFNLFVIPLFEPSQSKSGLTEQGCRTAYLNLYLQVKALLHLRKGFDVFERIKFQPVGRQHLKDKIRGYIAWLQELDVLELFEAVFDKQTTIFCKTNVEGMDCNNESCKAMAHFSELAHVMRKRKEKAVPHVPITSSPPFNEIAFFRHDPDVIYDTGKDFYVQDFMNFVNGFKLTLKANTYLVAVSKTNSEVPTSSTHSLKLRQKTVNSPYYIYVGRSTFSGVSPCSFLENKVKSSLSKANLDGFIHQYEVFNEEFDTEKAEVIEGLIQLGYLIYKHAHNFKNVRIRLINERTEYSQIALASFETLCEFFTVCLSPSGFLLEDDLEDPNEGLVPYIGKRLIIKQSRKLPGSYPHIPCFDEQGNMYLETQVDRDSLDNDLDLFDLDNDDDAIL